MQKIMSFIGKFWALEKQVIHCFDIKMSKSRLQIGLIVSKATLKLMLLND